MRLCGLFRVTATSGYCRSSLVTNLAKGGVSPKVAQTLARHSDIRLTMNVYTHTDLAEKACAIAKLPSFEKHAATTSVSDGPTSYQSDGQQRFSSSPVTEIDIRQQSLSTVEKKDDRRAFKRRIVKPYQRRLCQRMTKNVTGFQKYTWMGSNHQPSVP